MRAVSAPLPALLLICLALAACGGGAGGADPAPVPAGDPVPTPRDAAVAFGMGGIVTRPVTSMAFDVARYADGRVVAVGGTTSTAPGPALVFVLNRDGSLDTSFGTHGEFRDTLRAPAAAFSSVALQPDGKIVTGGAVMHDPTTQQAVVVRLLANGAFDPSFNGGLPFVLPGSSPDEAVTDLLLQPDGRILGIGNRTGEVFAFRLTPDGRLDPSFGWRGVTSIFTRLETELRAVALQSDGSAVAVGATSDGGIADIHGLVLRLTPAGVLDTAFGTGGLLEVDFSPDTESLSGVHVQTDDSIVAVGASDIDALVVRLTSGGLPDASFGAGGRVIYSAVDPLHTLGAQEVLEQPDGSLLVVSDLIRNFGLFTPGPFESAVHVARFGAGGVPDATLSGVTAIIQDVGTGDFVLGALRRPSGEVVVAGFAVDDLWTGFNIKAWVAEIAIP